MKLLKKLFGKQKKSIECFPEINDVFKTEKENLDLVFFPLCSINLKKVIPNRDEWIHFVDVWNNGEVDEAFFHEYRTRDIIRFQLENSKYKYLGGEKNFPKYEFLKNWKKEAADEFENNRLAYLKVIDSADFQKSDRKLKEDKRYQNEPDYSFYIDRVITYLVTKERFKKNGKLIALKSYPKEYKVKQRNPITQIGGKPNWLQRDQTPIDENGYPFTFIGEVTGFHYMKNGSGGIFLFLNEKSNEVVQVIQFG